MKKYKILIIHPTDPSGNKVGGVEIFLKGFIKYAPEEFDISFIGTDAGSGSARRAWSKRYLGQKEFSFYPVITVADENKKSVVPLMLRFAAALKINNPDTRADAVFLQKIEPSFVLRGALKNVILVVHNDIQKQIYAQQSEVLWRFFPWLYSFVEAEVFATARKIYSVSASTIKYYKKRYHRFVRKFEFLPTWFDPEIFYPVQETKMESRQRILSVYRNIRFRNHCLLFAGRLEAQKAPVRLIESFHEYRKYDADSCLIIIGEGNQRGSVERKIAELRLPDSVFLLGAIGQPRMADFYNAADALLLASNFEGMPICVLEALACGLPVVSTDVGEVKRAVTDGFSGEIVKNFLAEDIAAAIRKVLGNPTRYTRENCVFSVKEFTPDKVLQPVYDEIMKICREKHDEI
jgi:glycosyltransferase involved in cell wall biosynthesis